MGRWERYLINDVVGGGKVVELRRVK